MATTIPPEQPQATSRPACHTDTSSADSEVHGNAKQGSGYGYSGGRGLNALLATVSTKHSAPVVLAQRLRKGACGSSRGAKRLVADALKTLQSLQSLQSVQASARECWCGPTRRSTAPIRFAPRSGVEPMSRLPCGWTSGSRPRSPRSPTQVWTPIEYTDAVFDEEAGRWISRAEVAEIEFTAFGSRKKAEQVPGRLVVRRIPDLNPTIEGGQGSLFDLWRFHAFFTISNLDTVAADKTHRGHAIIEQVHADLKNSALAHLPSGGSPPTPPGWCSR